MKRIYLILILILLSGCTSFHTPEIRGKVTDAETGKPLAGVNVKAVWKVGVGTPGGVGGDPENYKYHKTRTDENGQFVLPEMGGRKKAVIGTYEGVTILVYRLGYRPGSLKAFGGRGWKYEKDNRKPDFVLERLKTEDDYNNTLYSIPWDSVGSDHKFIINFLYDYINKFPKSQKISELLMSIAEHYMELRDYDSSSQVYKEIIRQFPDTVDAGLAMERLEKNKISRNKR